MWPFKKKIVAEKTKIQFDSVLCIPGNWQSDKDVKIRIVQATNGEYIAAGNVMMNAKNDRHFAFEVCERDERMRKSFAVAGQVTSISFLK